MLGNKIMQGGKIHIRELEGGSQEWELTAQEEWVRAFLSRFAPKYPTTDLKPEEWASQVKYKAQVRASKIDPEYLIEGSFEAEVPVLCAKCGESGVALREASFRVFCKMLDPRVRGVEAEAGDDPDYLIVQGSEIDLSPILGEHLVCSEPLVEKPVFDTNGQRHKCLEWKKYSGQILQKERLSPFAKLKDLVKENLS